MNGSPSHLLLGSSSQGLGASDAVTRALPGAGLGHLDRTPAVGQLSTYGSLSSESSHFQTFSSQSL